MNDCITLLTTQQIEAMFSEWLAGRRVPLTLAQFQQAIWDSEATLPEEVCIENDFPLGTTVGHAVRCSIAVYDQTGTEYRVATRINFGNEAASLRWWRNNKDNPNRVRLRRQDDGTYSLQIAGMSGPDLVDWKKGF